MKKKTKIKSSIVQKGQNTQKKQNFLNRKRKRKERIYKQFIKIKEKN